jgi:hypothetical protein
MNAAFSRTPTRNSINPGQNNIEDRRVEFIARATRRPPTPPASVYQGFTRRRRAQQPRSSWFTRRRQVDRIVPTVEDDEEEHIFSAPEVEPIAVAMPRQNSGESNKSGREYPLVNPVDLSEVPETDFASEMPHEVAEVVGQDGRDCCIPGRYAQECRICPEVMQPRRERAVLVQTTNPSVVQPEKSSLGGKRRKRKRRTFRKKQLKKRHYKKSRKH